MSRNKTSNKAILVDSFVKDTVVTSGPDIAGVKLLPEEKYVVANTMNVTGEKDICLLEVTATGNITNQLQLNINSPDLRVFNTDTNGSYLLAGTISGSLDGDATTRKKSFLARVDDSFNIEKQVAYSYHPQNEIKTTSSCHDLKHGPDQHYYAIIREITYVTHFTFLVKFNSEFDVIDVVDLRSGNTFDQSSLTFTEDNKILVANAHSLHIFNLNLEEQQQVVHPNHFFDKKIVIENGNDILAMGRRDDYGGQRKDVGFVARFDLETLQLVEEHIQAVVDNEGMRRLLITDFIVANNSIFYVANVDYDGPFSLCLYQLPMNDFSATVDDILIGGSGNDWGAKVQFNGLEIMCCAQSNSTDGDFITDGEGSKLAIARVLFS